MPKPAPFQFPAVFVEAATLTGDVELCGLPARVRDAAWSEWLDRFPPPPAQDRALLIQYERSLVDHLDAAPPVEQLLRSEALAIATDLILYCEDFQAAQAADVDVGLIDFTLDGAGLLAVFTPSAAVPFAALSFAAAAFGSYTAYQARRRQKIVNSLLARLRQLAWRLRR